MSFLDRLAVDPQVPMHPPRGGRTGYRFRSDRAPETQQKRQLGVPYRVLTKLISGSWCSTCKRPRPEALFNNIGFAAPKSIS